MEEHLLIAIIAALINVLLSIVVPPLLKKTQLPFAEEVRKSYECNKQYILVSSALIIAFVYMSLKVTPWVNSNFLGNIAEIKSVNPVNLATQMKQLYPQGGYPQMMSVTSSPMSPM